MNSTWKRYEKDLEVLISEGKRLLLVFRAMHCPETLGSSIYETEPDKAKAPKQMSKTEREKIENELQRKLSNAVREFSSDYQSWYSESKTLIGQLLPDRLDDFIRMYEASSKRKEIDISNYTIEDAIHGYSAVRTFDKSLVYGERHALHKLKQQVDIVNAVKKRFKSSLFDIKQLVQADLFDTELDAADSLARNNFLRAAGTMAGVVLERHLSQVADKHSLKAGKKKATLSTWNDLLKGSGVFDVAQWRFISHLGDVRNKCAHDSDDEPTKQEVKKLIEGVRETIKTVF